MRRAARLMLLATGLVSAAWSTGASAQIPTKIKDIIKKKVEQKADSIVNCAFDDKACQEKAKKDGKTVVVTDKEGKPLPKEQQKTQTAGGEVKSPDPGEGVWANYDFVPGERVLFREDFTGDRVGNFPRRLEFVKGNAEVVEWNGGRYLRSTANPTIFAIPLPENLPDRFTMEFQLTLPWWGTIVYAGPDGDPQDPSANNRKHSYLDFNCCDIGIKTNHGAESAMDARKAFDFDEWDGHLFNIRVQADGKYMKLYMENQRVANLPSADFARTNKIYFAVHPAGSKPVVMLGNISINAGGTEMYDALMKDGKFATQGIYFDIDSDHIRPESTPTLNEIVSMLKSHGDLKIRVDGHTDNTGTATHNQTLSEQRAAAVKAYLVTKGGVDAARVTSQGFGSTKPVGTNDTPEGRQANRRVELVKM